LAWDICNRYGIIVSTSTTKRIKQSILREINPLPPKPNWQFYQRNHPHRLWHGDLMEKVILTDENRTAFQLILLDDCSHAKNFLTESEMKKFLAAARKGRHSVRDFCLMFVAHRSSLQVSELIDIRLKDLDLEMGRIFVRRVKGSLSTHQPIEGDELRAIRAMLREMEHYPNSNSNYLFLSERTPLTGQAVNHLVAQTGKRAKQNAETFKNYFGDIGFADRIKPAREMIPKAEENINFQRLRLTICGAVQGVGFRPFVYACAKSCNLRGFVGNESGGVFVEVEGAEKNLIDFQNILRENAPPLASVATIKVEKIAFQGDADFRIVGSEIRESENTLVAPDASVCADCLRELFDKNDRRFHYPFINCTNCGPRFTIIKDIPYDRPQTTMSQFQMCERCQGEYDNPLDRRFHAQPNACPDCGPTVRFVSKNENAIYGEDAISATRNALFSGEIVAVKGIGGFHLACDAKNNSAVRTLRKRKGRIDKPFAVMCKDLKTSRSLAEITKAEEAILTSKERPIVLLRKKANNLSELVAPNNQFLGVMLAYSPLHYLLFDDNLSVLVMTSGNFSSEPIITDNAEALEKLSILADSFLLHDREIFVPCDDSVVRVFENEELPIRRSRGYAPFPVELPFKVPPILAVGGELKATFCLTKEEFAFLSQHLGDMENLETLEAFEKSIAQMRRLFRIEPEIVVSDLHPNYLSTNWASRNLAKIAAKDAKFFKVQHHHAHIASVMAENKLQNETVIGFAFDGTGYGTDGAVWGGEVLLVDYQGFERAAHLRYVPLAGGDASVKKPYRVALAHLWQAGVDWNKNLPCVAACPETERKILLKQFENKINTIPTSSFGRLFDAVAAIAGVRQTVTYEAQAAIEFEAFLDETVTDAYEFSLIESEIIEIDSSPLICAVALDVLNKVSVGVISAKFNNAAANLILRLAVLFRRREKLNKVALSGGCFQNVTLLKASLQRLQAHDFEVLTHRKVPPNDGGLALGQAMIAGYSLLK